MVEILAPLWSLVAGKPMAHHSHPVAFDDGLLTLESDCLAWSREMRRMSDDILARINRYLGATAVRKLKVRFVSTPMPSMPLPDKSQLN
ncbi:MAG: DciA family protein [Limisphaerales bacterium]